MKVIKLEVEGVVIVINPRTKVRANTITAFFCFLHLPDVATLKINRNLENSIKGNDVKTLQGLLNKYLGVSLALDGIFGPKTEKVVRNLQSQFRIVVDGIVGKQTTAVINSFKN